MGFLPLKKIIKDCIKENPCPGTNLVTSKNVLNKTTAGIRNQTAGIPVNFDDKIIVCGMDEVGRGPWAGPLYTCGLVFKKDPGIRGLKDSKKLSPARREQIYKKLIKCSYIGIGIVEVDELDNLGLSKSIRLAYQRALDELIAAMNLEKSSPAKVSEGKNEPVKPHILLIDGRDKLDLPIPAKSIIKGDEKVKIIACASIVAKVERDRLMCRLSKKYPKYGFNLHKGYGTARHQRALAKHGICEIHRKSFAPIREIISG